MIAESPVQQQLREYAALTIEKRELQEREREIERRLRALNGPLVDALLDAGIEGQRISLDGESYSLFPVTQAWARPRDGDMPALCAALKEHGGFIAAAVQESVNLMTLTGWCREHLREGREIPAEIQEHLEISQSPQVQVRRVGK
jgi:hypothetical protein